MRKLICSIVCALLLVSCGEYNKILKSTDYELKYDYAKKAFERKKYMQAATLLEELVAIFKGTDRAEESLYLLARSYYLNKDYVTSGEYFQAYYKNYPKGEYTELARFYCGYGYYLDSPEAKLDQTGTYKAIDEMQRFLDYFPNSERAKQAQDIIFELQDKLVYKELLNAQLYYNLGNYMGNNYQSAIITAQNALKDYPYTNLREDLSILILRAKYELAVYSVEERKQERYREAVDEYYAFKNEFPESKYLKEAERIFSKSQAELGEGSTEEEVTE